MMLLHLSTLIRKFIIIIYILCLSASVLYIQYMSKRLRGVYYPKNHFSLLEKHLFPPEGLQGSR